MEKGAAVCGAGAQHFRAHTKTQICMYVFMYVWELIAMCMRSVQGKECSGRDLASGEKEFLIAPATMSAYNSYGQVFDTGLGYDSMPASWNAQRGDVAMNNVVVVAEPTSLANTYMRVYIYIYIYICML